jgi:hypothetical protein
MRATNIFNYIFKEIEIMYGRKLTKTELLMNGITKVTTDGHVFRGDEEVIPVVNRQGYLMHQIYDIDDQGKKIKIPNEKSVFGYIYKIRNIGLHRLMWAWFHDEVQNGMVIDHLNNKHHELKDYDLSNLQCITPGENVRKEIKKVYVHKKMPKNLTEEQINQKLAYWTEQYELAKKNKDADRAHKIRTNLSVWRAKQRQFLAEPEKYTGTDTPIKPKEIQEQDQEQIQRRDCHANAEQRKQLLKAIKAARRFYDEAKANLGKNDPYTIKCRYEWKQAIAEHYAFSQEVSKSFAKL